MKNSVLKRVIGYTLICVMLLASFSTVAFASTTGGPAVTFTMNFDGFEDGTKISKSMGWNHIELPDDLIASDSENGKYLNLINIGYRNILVASETLDSGKVYVGFSYKHETPEGMTPGVGQNGLAIYVQSTVAAKSTQIESTVYTDVEDKVATRNANNFYIGALNENLKVDNNNSDVDTALETIGSGLWNSGWHEIGYILDLDRQKLQAFVDGEVSEEYDFSAAYKEGSGTLGAIGFKTPNNGYYFGSVDNFVVKYIPKDATNDVTATAVKDEAAKTIDITFDEPVSPQTLEAICAPGAVSMKLCGSSTAVNIDSVTKVNGAIRVTYKGDLQQGREYLVDLPENLKTIYGTELPDGVFVNANGRQADIFDNVIVPNNGFEDGVALDSSLHGPYAPTIIEIPESVADNGSNYILKPHTNNLLLGDNTTISSGNLKGMTVLEFDYVVSNANTVAIFYASESPAVWLPKATSWTHVKIEVDYAVNEMRIYIGDSAVVTQNSSTKENFPNLATTNYQRLWLGGGGFNNKGIYIDNFSQVYEYSITYPCVKSVRYTDADDDVTSADNVPADISKIEIAFSEDMNEESLENITVSPDPVTGRSYDAETFIYTLTCENGLTAATQYEITIPATVVSASGSVMEETIYKFNTLNGTFELSGLSLNENGTAISKADVSSLPGKSVTVSAQISNPDNTAGMVTLIYALYDNKGEMVDVNYTTRSFPEGRETVTSDIFTVKSGIVPVSAKVFAWKGQLTDLTPLDASVEY